MKRSTICVTAVLAGILLGVPGALASAPLQSSHPHAKPIVLKMIAALNRESRIEVSGTSHGKKISDTQYALRYQATGLEDYQVSPVGHKPGTSNVSLHYVMIGKTLYTYAKKHWYKLQQGSAPQAVGVLSLNTEGAFCCTTTGIRPGTRVSYHGTRTVGGVNSFVIKYHTGTETGGASGIIYVATGSYLPQAYTSTTLPQGTAGSFSLKYGGTFNIRAPKM